MRHKYGLLFMFLTTVRIGNKWFALSKIFQTRTDTLKKKIASFPHYMPEEMTDKQIKNVEYLLSSDMKNIKFTKLECAKYAVDVIFQKSNRALGTFDQVTCQLCIQDRSICSTEWCSNVLSPHGPGRKADIEILK